MDTIRRIFRGILGFWRDKMTITVELFDGKSLSFDPGEFIFAGFDETGENIILVISGKAPFLLPATKKNLLF